MPNDSRIFPSGRRVLQKQRLLKKINTLLIGVNISQTIRREILCELDVERAELLRSAVGLSRDEVNAFRLPQSALPVPEEEAKVSADEVLVKAVTLNSF
ncbi:MAG: hypothetical protein K0U12_02240 [Gammaproteobacteria bacterium]|nr:hypothetical protein [Gammaproteobacteria bacterium]